MPIQLSKTLLDQFETSLNKNFENYCETQEQENDNIQLIRYLIDHNLINITTIRRYAILKTYNKLLQQSNRKKVEMVRILSERFNISERSVYTILKEYQTYFERR